MDRQYTRIDSVREILDRDLKSIPDEEIKRCAGTQCDPNIAENFITHI